MKIRSLWLFVSTCILTLLFLSSCSKTKGLPKMKEKDLSMWIEKGSCYGKCAVYTMKVYSNKYALYEGRANTDKMGQYYKMISDSMYKALESAFEQSGFMMKDSVYRSDIADFPQITLGYKDGKKIKTVVYKENRPDEIHDLQLKLEKVANSFDWIALQKVEKQMEYTPVEGRQHGDDGVHLKNEIIVEPNANTDIEKWLQRYQGYDLAIVKKIAPNFNYYLLSWNTSIITPDEMLAKLKSDKELKSAEFNKKIMKRDE